MPALPNLLRTSAFRWIAGYLVVFLVAIAAVVGYIFWLTSEQLGRELAGTISAEVAGLRERFESGGIAELERAVRARSGAPGNSLYVLVDGSGRRLAGNLSGVPGNLLGSPGGGSFVYDRETDLGREERHAVGVAIAVPGRLALVVGRDVEEQQTFAAAVRRTFLWGTAVIALAGLIGGLLASRALLRRVDTVTEASRSIMTGSLSRRLPVSGSGDEFDRLSHGLNAMLDRIEQLMIGLREVSDNIAHDLKTPLTRLRNRAEAALGEAAGTGHKRALELTIEEADGLIRTFNALLSIARLEAGHGSESFSRLDLAAVAREAVELYEPVAEAAGYRLEVATTDSPAIRGDRQLIGQAIGNLIDNAIKYGRPSASPGIFVSVEADREARVVVADRGPGIPSGDRERATKRFVRLEASRSEPGSGLGLSLVAAVARLHGGGLRLEDNCPGLRAVIALPRAPAQDGTSI
ncbi:MAG: HAMP domain-containing sensor histidine kinase [Hyphomicrobiaceae bacterium]